MSRRAVAWAICAWLGVVAVGMGLLVGHAFAPGAEARAPERWPDASGLERSIDEPTLVFVAHPHCSCTRASIAELAQLMTDLAGRVRAYVLFVRPEGFETDWERTDLWASASSIDGVEVISDAAGVEAALFGAMTSGQAYLYGPAGTLLFRGGITPSRSHRGDNVGLRRILALVRGASADRDVSDVYGCPLDEAGGDEFWLSDLRSLELLR